MEAVSILDRKDIISEIALFNIFRKKKLAKTFTSSRTKTRGN
jgi:hypothetical protein